MRRFGFVAVLVLAAGSSGCKPGFFQTSVHPFFEQTETSIDIGGRWVEEGETPDVLVFSPAPDHRWRLNVVDHDSAREAASEASGVLVRLGRVGGELYWDMTEDGPAGDLGQEHRLSLHSVARLRIDGDSMQIDFLDPDWMVQALADGRVDLPHLRVEDDGPAVLTASTEELQAFLSTLGEGTEAFREPEVYHRVR